MPVELVKVTYYYCVCKCGFCGPFCLPPSLPIHSPLLPALLRLHSSLRLAHLQRVSMSPARWASKGPAVCVFCAVRFLLVYVFLLSYRYLQLSKWASVCVFLPRWGNLSEEQQVQSSTDRLVQIGLCQRPTVWVWPMNVSHEMFLRVAFSSTLSNPVFSVTQEPQTTKVRFDLSTSSTSHLHPTCVLLGTFEGP